MLLLMLCIMAIGVVIIHMVARTLAAPVSNFADLAEDTAQGRWDSPIPKMKWEELNRLGNSFELMRGKIQAQLLGLKSFNLRLEKEVARQTQALKEKNAELTTANQDLLHTQEQMVVQEKMASLGTLTAGLAHEINTPLGTCVTGTSHLQEKLRELVKNYGDDALTQEALESFMKQSEQTISLLMRNLKTASDLVESFKQLAGDSTPREKRLFHLKSSLERELHLMTQCGVINSGKHQVTVDIPDSLVLKSHPRTLGQIIRHLVRNAMDHAFVGSSPGRVTIRSEVTETETVIHCSDNGQGIPLENQAKIFDPFFTTARGSGGKGLGLHMVYNLVHMHLKGKIKVQSDSQEGTRFSIRFPHGAAANSQAAIA